MRALSLTLLSGNVRGGGSPRDPDELAPSLTKGKVWEDRIPGQVNFILSSGADLFFATECRNENSMYLLLLAALQAADPASSWQASEGANGNQTYYKGTKLSFASTSDHKYTASPGTDRYFVHKTLHWLDAGIDLDFVLTHMHPFEPDARKKDAAEVRDYMATRKIDAFLGDFNSETEGKKGPRDLWRQAGWLQMRERGPVMNSETGTGPHGQWLEDIYTRPGTVVDVSGMQVMQARKSGLTDHVGWLLATITEMVPGTASLFPGAVLPVLRPDSPIAPNYAAPLLETHTRYIVQNILTGDFSTMELPITTDGPSFELSASGSLSGTIAPEMRYRVPIEEWQSVIYQEVDGDIRWGGIVQGLPSEGSTLTVEAAGFTSYPNGIDFVGPLYKKKDWDPTQAFADLWAHVQSQVDGNLGVEVVVSSSCPVRIGTKAEPYVMAPEESPDVGEELAKLAEETPFDFVERHFWDGPIIRHQVVVGWPRLGRRRDDLAFVQGDNVISLVPVDRDGDAYANTIHGIGKGEGKKTLTVQVAQRDGRLRRTATFTDKMASTEKRLTAECNREFASRQLVPQIESITVRHHPNAPLGSWSLGDDILVQGDVPWEGRVSIWCKVVAWQQQGQDKAVLTLSRSDIAAGVALTPPPAVIVPTDAILPSLDAYYDDSYLDSAYLVA